MGAVAGMAAWGAHAAGLLRPGSALGRLLGSGCLATTLPSARPGSTPRPAAAIALRGLAWAVSTPVAVSAGLGAAAAYGAFPVSRYWAETNLAGKRYTGTTASNTMPREPVPPLFSLQVRYLPPLKLLRSCPCT